MKRHRPLRSGLAALLLGAALCAGLPAAESRAAPPDAATLDYRLAARELAPGVFVVEGANDDFSPANGCNIINTGFIVTDAGVLVVNTGPSRRYGEQLRALVERTAGKPVAQVLHLNLHPDYFLGNQAFADVPRLATAATASGMAAEAKAYEDNLYRMCGDWMRGTEALLPDRTVQPGRLVLGGREFELREYEGHTASDLVLVDRASGVVFAGGLVFADRIPTTPHARIEPWLKSLDALGALPFRAMVPSHGPVVHDARGIGQTRAYLRWLDESFRSAAEQGWDMAELLAQPIPPEFRDWAALRTEYVRNVAHLYPRYEQRALGKGR
ncbi:quinoprotein relay system zinc metallohydrolase 1 [Caldimonas tepidiphila]|uniref:quinoprotein relay system zinc metallohydrolase 1 n=1 Tax=Caldimonas tepidiphila TaxID=2315841 RepID=UPI000E5B226D|nr:quinoprotein relay system zinc metallohydrolase 1 [Caldimonas tepidiphila]